MSQISSLSPNIRQFNLFGYPIDTTCRKVTSIAIAALLTGTIGVAFYASALAGMAALGVTLSAYTWLTVCLKGRIKHFQPKQAEPIVFAPLQEAEATLIDEQEKKNQEAKLRSSLKERAYVLKGDLVQKIIKTSLELSCSESLTKLFAERIKILSDLRQRIENLQKEDAATPSELSGASPKKPIGPSRTVTLVTQIFSEITSSQKLYKRLQVEDKIEKFLGDKADFFGQLVAKLAPADVKIGEDIAKALDEINSKVDFIKKDASELESKVKRLQEEIERSKKLLLEMPEDNDSYKCLISSLEAELHVVHQKIEAESVERKVEVSGSKKEVSKKLTAKDQIVGYVEKHLKSVFAGWFAKFFEKLNILEIKIVGDALHVTLPNSVQTVLQEIMIEGKPWMKGAPKDTYTDMILNKVCIVRFGIVKNVPTMFFKGVQLRGRKNIGSAICNVEYIQFSGSKIFLRRSKMQAGIFSSLAESSTTKGVDDNKEKAYDVVSEDKRTYCWTRPQNDPTPVPVPTWSIFKE